MCHILNFFHWLIVGSTGARPVCEFFSSHTGLAPVGPTMSQGQCVKNFFSLFTHWPCNRVPTLLLLFLLLLLLQSLSRSALKHQYFHDSSIAINICIIHGRKEDSTGVHLEVTKTKTHTKTNTRTKTELSRRKSSCIYKYNFFV